MGGWLGCQKSLHRVKPALKDEEEAQQKEKYPASSDHDVTPSLEPADKPGEDVLPLPNGAEQDKLVPELTNGAHPQELDIISKVPEEDPKDIEDVLFHDRARSADITERCWQEIERQCEGYVSNEAHYLSSGGSSVSGWRVVRLFVSSTFHDFQNEREILVKKVFPELREWCESRRLHLIECDLRWGIPKDSTTRTVLTTCMHEIDRCHGDASGNGFFLNMLGERYGWVPSKHDVPGDVSQQYEWVPFTSVTHMEVLLGAYRSRNPNAAFFLRDPSSFLDSIPTESRSQFEDGRELGKLQLKELKQRLQQRFPEQTFAYTCQLDQMEGSKILLKGLEDFGRGVLEFFQGAVKKNFPESNQISPTPEILEQEKHDIYMVQKGRLVIGRDAEIGKMMEFAHPGGDSALAGDDAESHHMVVVADPGEGKSSLMARFVTEAQKAGLVVFYHFVGCTAESNRPQSILQRLVAKLEETFTDLTFSKSSDDFKDKPDRLLQAKLDEYTEQLNPTGRQFLIAVDAVNQSSRQDWDRFCWLPATLAGNMRCVVSTTKEGCTLGELNDYLSGHGVVTEVALASLGMQAREDIVTQYFSRYIKILDSEQLSILIQSQGASNVLWLSLSCEELRVFGQFDEVTDRIRAMPATLDGLIDDILGRLISEDETQMLEKMLHFLEISDGGLSETELAFLLGDLDSGEPAPALHWAVVRRMLKPFLRNSGAYGQQERLQFFHLSLNKAVQKRLSDDPETKVLRHRQLADYYQYRCRDARTVTARLGRQLTLAREGQRLVDFYRMDRRSVGVNKIEKSRFLEEFRCKSMTPRTFGGCTTLAYCRFCANQRAFNSPFSIKDCCAICSERLPVLDSQRSMVAYCCPFHRPRFANPSLPYHCLACQKPVMSEKNPALAYICDFCSWNRMERCCQIPVVK